MSIQSSSAVVRTDAYFTASAGQGPVRVSRLGTPSLPISSRGGLSLRALQRATAYIEQHLGDKLGLQDIATAACISRFHFARLFRVSTGCSPMEYLFQARIERAKRLLLEGDRTIGELAVELGFSDQSHFSRHFRRATGLSPRKFLHQVDGSTPELPAVTWRCSFMWHAPAAPESTGSNRWPAVTEAHAEAIASTPVLEMCRVEPDAGFRIALRIAGG